MKYFIPLVLILFLSCHKKIIKKNSDYEGNWIGRPTNSSGPDVVNLDISSDSYLKYARHPLGGGGDNISGTARLGKNNIHVKIYDFKTISSPEKIDSVIMSTAYGDTIYAHWKMELLSPKIYGGYDVVYYRK